MDNVIALDDRKQKPISAVPLCKNCIHCYPDKSLVFLFSNHRWRYSKCSKVAKEMKVDCVTGEVSNGMFYASIARMFTHGGLCGPDGRHFSPRPQEGFFKKLRKLWRRG